MIAADQPTIFPADRVTVGLSSVIDGDMKFIDDTTQANYHHRLHFLDEVGVEPTQTTRVWVAYDNTPSFVRYAVVDDSHLGEGMLDDDPLQPADALVVTRPGHALFLPLADCVGAVLYDPVAQVLMVSHLGRHSAQVDGAAQSVRYLQDQFASQPDNLLVWLSPAVGAPSYPLSGSDNAGLHDLITTQLLRSGVAANAIETCAVDTAVSADYFSHSQFVARNQATDGRFAIVAMMHE